jgi:hypothetical protein
MAVAKRKAELFSLLFDFDTKFYCQNSKLNRNGWHHSIPLARARRNHLLLFTFRPIIDPSSCIEVEGIKSALFATFRTPSKTYQHAKKEFDPPNDKKLGGNINENVPINVVSRIETVPRV